MSDSVHTLRWGERDRWLVVHIGETFIDSQETQTPIRAPPSVFEQPRPPRWLTRPVASTAPSTPPEIGDVPVARSRRPPSGQVSTPSDSVVAYIQRLEYRFRHVNPGVRAWEIGIQHRLLSGNVEKVPTSGVEPDRSAEAAHHMTNFGTVPKTATLTGANRRAQRPRRHRGRVTARRVRRPRRGP